MIAQKVQMYAGKASMSHKIGSGLNNFNNKDNIGHGSIL